MLVFVAFLTLFPLAVFAQTPSPTPYWVTCQYKNNGLLQIGCWGYIKCVNGVPYTTYCTNGQVLDQDHMQCVTPSAQHLQCNKKGPCPSKFDRRYADHDANCESYYLCLAGSFVGRFYCPKGTVFNEVLQTCDYPGDTAPPCGTLTYTRTTFHA